MFSNDQLRIVRFIAEECQRQESGEFSVYRMLRAWNLADETSKINEETILNLAFAIDSRNEEYRKVPVTFANGNHGTDVADVPRLMLQLFTTGADLMTTDPEAWIKELLRIHPLVDGNGRLAAILWNKLNNTMLNPTSYPAQEWT